MPKFVTKAIYHPSHYLIYGPPGTMKSSLTATFPKPMYVAFFDSYSKDDPYLNRGLFTELDVSDSGVPFREVYSRKDNEKLLIHIDYFHDTDPDEPTAYDLFAERMSELKDALFNYKTIVTDSLTSLIYAARLKGRSLPHQDDDNWFEHNMAKQFLERYMRSIFQAFHQNLVLVAHTTKERIKNDKEGMLSFLYSPAAPGTLKEELPSIFPECYAVRVIKDKEGKKVLLQTQPDNKMTACTQISAPDGVEMKGLTYQHLWGNFKENA